MQTINAIPSGLAAFDACYPCGSVLALKSELITGIPPNHLTRLTVVNRVLVEENGYVARRYSLRISRKGEYSGQIATFGHDELVFFPVKPQPACTPTPNPGDCASAELNQAFARQSPAFQRREPRIRNGHAVPQAPAGLTGGEDEPPTFGDSIKPASYADHVQQLTIQRIRRGIDLINDGMAQLVAERREEVKV